MTLDVAAGYSLLGLCVVFGMLAIIMGMTTILRAWGKDKPKPQEAAAPATQPVAPVAAAAPMGDMTAPGNGTVSVSGIDAKTAALLMSVVSEEMRMPLNQLKFISMKEI